MKKVEHHNTMKKFEYYNSPKTPFFGFEESKRMRNKLIKEIDEKPMTKAERTEAIREVDNTVKKHAEKKNEFYREQCNVLEKEFWNDAREDLGYGKLFNEKGVKAIEHMAYERGHAYGFSSIYNELQEIVDFVKTVIENLK